MTETKLSIYSALSADTIIAKLKASTVETNKQSQTNYQQIFQGKILNDYAEIFDIEAIPRNKVLYKIKINKFENGMTNIQISNSKFENRQFTNSLLKALILPFGVVILIVSFTTIQNSDRFLTGLGCGFAFIIIPLVYKLRPLSESEFLNDHVIQNILKLLDPIEIKLMSN